MLREVSERDNQKEESTGTAFQGCFYDLNMFLYNGLLGATRECLIYRSLQLIADGGGVSKLTLFLRTLTIVHEKAPPIIKTCSGHESRGTFPSSCSFLGILHQQVHYGLALCAECRRRLAL